MYLELTQGKILRTKKNMEQLNILFVLSSQFMIRKQLMPIAIHVWRRLAKNSQLCGEEFVGCSEVL